MIKSKEQDQMQKELDIVKNCVKENLTEFSVEKFEQVSHGMINNISATPYKSEANVTDLEVILMRNSNLKSTPIRQYYRTK